MGQVSLALAGLLYVTAPGPFDWPVIRAIDGDSIQIRSLIPGVSLSVRVRGIDTPERPPRAKCKREAALAQQASQFTAGLVGAARTIRFTNIDNDKFGGRLLATVWIDGKDLARELISQGLARAYHGEKKKGWC